MKQIDARVLLSSDLYQMGAKVNAQLGKHYNCRTKLLKNSEVRNLGLGELYSLAFEINKEMAHRLSGVDIIGKSKVSIGPPVPERLYREEIAEDIPDIEKELNRILKKC